MAQAFEFAEKCSRDIHSQSSPPLPVLVNSVDKEVSRSNSSTIPASVYAGDVEHLVHFQLRWHPAY